MDILYLHSESPGVRVQLLSWAISSVTPESPEVDALDPRCRCPGDDPFATLLLYLGDELQTGAGICRVKDSSWIPSTSSGWDSAIFYRRNRISFPLQLWLMNSSTIRFTVGKSIYLGSLGYSYRIV